MCMNSLITRDYHRADTNHMDRYVQIPKVLENMLVEENFKYCQDL